MEKKKRIVVKVGTNVLTKADGTLDKPIFRQVVVQLAKMIELGWRPILVSSGAVGAGRAIVSDCEIEDEAIRRQVLSSVGQASLMKRYYELFHEYDIVCSQVLTTKEDFAPGDHYQNMVNCFEGLLSQGIVPIVNENDVVSLTELMFTDNDELAGLTAQMVSAEKLIILSNVDGLFTGTPGEAGAELVATVGQKDDSHMSFISATKSTQGRGGMGSKYEIAKRSASVGVETFIANGKRENVITDILDGKSVGTRFLVQTEKIKA
ncbi:MAG: glutamate 5-kinase [Cyclobacteriaceae bacterium]